MDIPIVELDPAPTAAKAASDWHIEEPAWSQWTQQKKGDDPLKVHGPVTPASGKKLLDAYRSKIAEQRGIKVPESPQVLGQGTRGTAFALDGSTVLKLTEDESEAKAAMRLKETAPELAVKVMDVFALSSTGYFGVVQERLEKLPGTIASTLQQALDQTKFTALLRNHNLDPELVEDELRDNIKELQLRGENGEVKRQNKYIETLKNMGIFRMVTELNQLGIKFHDYHNGNFMVRDGNKLVLIDLGYSQVAGGKEPEVVEKKLREKLAIDYMWHRRQVILRG